MIERIACLSVLRLKPGMRLARALLRPDGAVLMAEGTELSDNQLNQLQQRAVEFVFVSQIDTRSPEELERDGAAAEARLDYIFRTPPGLGPDQPGWQDGRVSLKEAVLSYRRAGWSS